MRAVVQRVLRARVTVVTPETLAERVTGEIGPGLVVLLGVAEGDALEDAELLAQKICELRVFEDDAGKMNRSLLETRGGLLVVSQFTLIGDCRKGRRPSFIAAARPEVANPLYQHFLAIATSLGLNVSAGEFQTQMRVELVNDGPVTLLLDSRKQF